MEGTLALREFDSPSHFYFREAFSQFISFQIVVLILIIKIKKKTPQNAYDCIMMEVDQIMQMLSAKLHAG